MRGLGASIRCASVALVVALAVAPGRARAADYGVDLDTIDSEDDLYQLYWDGLIDEDARDRLVTLFAIKVDLNSATREELQELPHVTAQIADEIIAYREKNGPFRSADHLALVPAVQGDPFTHSRPFVVARLPAPDDEHTFSGSLLGGVIHRTSSASDPAFFLRGRAQPYQHLRLGFLIMPRPKLGDVRVSDAGTLEASSPATRFDMPGFYAMWDGPKLQALAGTYRIGFGQRLTLDNTRLTRPHGFFPNDQHYENNLEGKVSPIDGFVGGAVRARYLPWALGWVDATAFFSWANRDLYFAELQYTRADTDPFIVDPATGASIPYATLPDILRERLGGANVTQRFSRRSWVGLTGYYGDVHVNAVAPGVRLAISSKYPENRTRFGAFGLDGGVGAGIVDVGAEVSLTDQGALATLVRAWIEPVSKLQIMPSARYYAPEYDNPYARGQANADELFGNRARDELGGRVRVSSRQLAVVHFLGDLDVWRHENPAVFDPETGRPLGSLMRPTVDLLALGRVDVHVTTKERLALWGTYHDEDLENGGRQLAYASSTTPGGARITATAFLETRRLRRAHLGVLYRHVWVDTTAFDDRFDQAFYVWGRAILDFKPGPHVTLRAKYLAENLDVVPARSTSYRYCEDEEAAAGTVGEPIPAACRGERSFEALVLLRQSLGLFEDSYAKLRFSWTRYLDRRAKWNPLPTATIPDPAFPSRDDFLIKVSAFVAF